MMTKDKIMKVLDAMNYAIPPSGTFWIKKHNEAKQILQAALAEPSEAVWLPSTEWTPCMKLPVVVHVRKQREGESHVSTREGITPVKPDDLIMRGVSGEEYPIGREIFEKTYRIGDTHPAPSKPEPDKDLIQALTERDEYHEMADKLAEGIALHFDGDIGEHGSSNSPWDRALDLLDSAACAETMRLTRPASKPEKLTDEEIKRIQMSDPAYMTCSCPAFARQVEAAVWAKFAAVKQDEAIKEKFE